MTEMTTDQTKALVAALEHVERAAMRFGQEMIAAVVPLRDALREPTAKDRTLDAMSRHVRPGPPDEPQEDPANVGGNVQPHVPGRLGPRPTSSRHPDRVVDIARALVELEPLHDGGWSTAGQIATAANRARAGVSVILQQLAGDGTRVTVDDKWAVVVSHNGRKARASRYRPLLVDIRHAEPDPPSAPSAALDTPKVPEPTSKPAEAVSEPESPPPPAPSKRPLDTIREIPTPKVMTKPRGPRPTAVPVAGGGTAQGRILESLAPGAATVAELAAATQLPVETVRFELRRMRGAGDIRAVGNRRGQPAYEAA